MIKAIHCSTHGRAFFTVLAIPVSVALSQMQPLTPYRLTRNEPGAYSYITSGRVNDVGYRTETFVSGGSFSNAFLFADGNPPIQLSQVSDMGGFAAYAGRVDGQILFHEGHGSGGPLERWVDLIRYTGQSAGVNITGNPPGVSARLTARLGRAFITSSHYDAVSGLNPSFEDILAYENGGSFNLTRNGPGERSEFAFGGTATDAFIRTRYGVVGTSSDLLRYRFDTAPAAPITQNATGGSVGDTVYGGPDEFFFGRRRDSDSPFDVYKLGTSGSVNLTNTVSGFGSSYVGSFGSGAILSRSSETGPLELSTRNLLFYRDGAITQLTAPRPGYHSQYQGVFQGRAVLYTGPVGTLVGSGASNIELFDGATFTPLTLNPPGKTAQFATVGENAFIKIGGNLESLHLVTGTATITLSSLGGTQRFLDFPSLSNGAVVWRVEDRRFGNLDSELIHDLYLFGNGTVSRLSSNTAGQKSSFLRLVGGDALFRTFTSSTANSDIWLFDGATSRNLTNLPTKFQAALRDSIGDDFVVSITDYTLGNSGSLTSNNLYRYSRTGQRIAYTENGVGEGSGFLDVIGDRVVWTQSLENASGYRSLGIFSGDGTSSPQLLFAPPADQVLQSLYSTDDNTWFFMLSGGSGTERFSNILAYHDGQMIPLTNNGPGWLAYLRPPGFQQLFNGEPNFSEIGWIALEPVNGDRRDLIAFSIPEPGLAAMFSSIVCAAGLRRSLRTSL